MGTAQEEIDRIHQAEQAAQKRIEDAKSKARDMKKDAETKATEIFSQKESDAKQEAERLLKEKEDSKIKIEGSILSSADDTVAKYQETAKKKQNSAMEAVVKIILGEVQK
jgi:vacuolar-type H+-ATPase subunit H